MSEMLIMNKICKSYFGVEVLKDISVSIQKGEILGIVGENGAGKSTLMNILGGVTKSDSGSISIFDKLYEPKNPSDAINNGISFIHQELNIFPNLTIAENVYIDKFPKGKVIPVIDKKNLNQRTEGILREFGLDLKPNMLVEKLAPGERQLVEIIKALASNPEIIIFDEPTTSLTKKETEILFKLIRDLKKRRKIIILISHILEHIKEHVDNILVLRNGSIADYDTSNDMTVDRMIASMIGHDISQMYPDYENNKTETIVLEAKNLTKRGVIRNISFRLYQGEILGIFGLMGSGRTELTKFIFGLDRCDSGQIIIKQKTLKKNNPSENIERGVGYITENRHDEGLLMNFSVANNISLVSLKDYRRKISRFINNKNMLSNIKTMVEKLGITKISIESFAVKSLSGGNQQKVVIAKWLLAHPEIFIIDEPTRGIDVGSKAEIYRLIKNLSKESKSILLISSEVEELMGLCDRIIVMSMGEIVGEFSREEFITENIIAASFRQKVKKQG